MSGLYDCRRPKSELESPFIAKGLKARKNILQTRPIVIVLLPITPLHTFDPSPEPPLRCIDFSRPPLLGRPLHPIWGGEPCFLELSEHELVPLPHNQPTKAILPSARATIN